MCILVQRKSKTARKRKRDRERDKERERERERKIRRNTHIESYEYMCMCTYMYTYTNVYFRWSQPVRQADRCSVLHVVPGGEGSIDWGHKLGRIRKIEDKAPTSKQ